MSSGLISAVTCVTADEVFENLLLSTGQCKLKAIYFMMLNLSGKMCIILFHTFSIIPAFYSKSQVVIIL
jgi:hypothetical protein